MGDSIILEYDAASMGDRTRTFREKALFSFSRV